MYQNILDRFLNPTRSMVSHGCLLIIVVICATQTLDAFANQPNPDYANDVSYQLVLLLQLLTRPICLTQTIAATVTPITCNWYAILTRYIETMTEPQHHMCHLITCAICATQTLVVYANWPNLDYANNVAYQLVLKLLRWTRPQLLDQLLPMPWIQPITATVTLVT
jgi:hypothetical protein